MRDHTLANLILDDEGFLAEHPGMLFRAEDGSARYDTSREGLVLSGTVDFTTYLNAISVGKWQSYCGISVFCLRLELKGAACEVLSTSLGPNSVEVARSYDALVHVGASDSWQVVDVVVPVAQGAHIASFALRSAGEVVLRQGYWYTKVNDADVRDVRLAIATTTFRKETYVTRNIEAIRKEIFASGYEHADGVQLALEQLFPADLVGRGSHVDIRPGQVDGRRQHIQRRHLQLHHRRADRFIGHQDFINTVTAVKAHLVCADAMGGVPLRIQVNKQHPAAGICQSRRQIHAGGCFAYAAFLHRDSNDFSHTSIPHFGNRMEIRTSVSVSSMSLTTSMPMFLIICMHWFTELMPMRIFRE